MFTSAPDCGQLVLIVAIVMESKRVSRLAYERMTQMKPVELS